MTETTLDQVNLDENGQSSELTPKSTNVTNVEFVEEVRTARLDLLWKVSLAGIFLLLWVILLLTGTSNTDILDLIIPSIAILVASGITRFLLDRGRLEAATLAYILGLITTVSMMVAMTEQQYIVFTGILVIFVIGMLTSVRSTFILLGVSLGAMIFMPLAFGNDAAIDRDDVFAYLLMGVAALLVAQISGELYSVAEWALDNYRKERTTANQLHESRQEIQKTLLKQKNLTEQVQEINEELDEARQAAEMAKHFRGVFLANMSHELRTPLNAIIGFSDTMLNFPIMYNNVELPPEYLADLKQIHTSGNHLLNIINDILDISRIDAGRLEVEYSQVELLPIFDGVLATAVGLVGGKPVELKRDVEEDLPVVWADPLRTRQVIINLFSNAAKFTQEGEIKLTAHHTDDFVTISVSDTGPGIEPELLPSIFEAFQQGESGKRQKRQGAGLGLAISRQLLELMNGEIWVESELDQGSTFYIKLPVYNEAIHGHADDAEPIAQAEEQ